MTFEKHMFLIFVVKNQEYNFEAYYREIIELDAKGHIQPGWSSVYIQM